jgi:hypothetical protein
MTQPRRAAARLVLVLAALTVVGILAAPLASARGVARRERQPDVAALPAQQALDAIRRGDLGTYLVIRQQVAALVAPRIGLDARQLDQVWARTDGHHMSALFAALSQLGVPYHRRASSAGEAFDCSGLTSWAWGQAGLLLAHQSGVQIHSVARRSLAQVVPGDLLYYPGHVMMSLGIGGAMVHAPYTGTVVQVQVLSAHQQRRIRVGDPLG